MNKRILVLLTSIILSSFFAQSQEYKNSINKAEIQLGYTIGFRNFFNIKPKPVGDMTSGYSIDLLIPTRYQYLKINFGGIYQGYTNVSTGAYSGGAYFGPCLVLGGKHLGFMGNVNFGYFQTSMHNDTYNYIGNFGSLGSLIKIGFYLKIGPITFSPSYFSYSVGSSTTSIFSIGGINLSVGLALENKSVEK